MSARIAFAALFSSLLAACGSGGGSPGTAEDNLLVAAILSEAAWDGHVNSFGASVMEKDLRVGDGGSQDPKLAYRAYVSFPIGEMFPQGTEILKAVIELQQEAVTGSVIPTHGPVMLDHVEYELPLDDDYFLVPNAADIGQVTDQEAPGMRTIDVTAYVQENIKAGKKRTQFRLRLPEETDGDGADDYVTFSSSEALGPGSIAPVLRITYK